MPRLWSPWTAQHQPGITSLFPGSAGLVTKAHTELSLSLYPAGHSGPSGTLLGSELASEGFVAKTQFKRTQMLFQSLCLAKLPGVELCERFVWKQRGRGQCSADSGPVPCCRMEIHPARILGPATPS